MFDLNRYRSELPILKKKNYLNACSLGPISHRTIAYLQEFQQLWAERGTMAWEVWFEEYTGRLKNLLSPILTANPEEIALQPNASAALATVASLVNFGRRRKVVVGALDFPTTIHQWLVKAGLGIEVVRVPSDDGISIPPERFAEYIDEDTALVATTHVYAFSGYIQDLRPIAEAAHRKGALLCVDGYHAVGSIPVDVRASGCDFYVAGVLKWLMGGPGQAFLWVHPDHAQRAPTIASWLGARNPFAMDNERWEPAEDARRFEYGTPAVAAVYQAMAGLEIINEVGLPLIRERQKALSRLVVERALARGYKLRSPIDDEQRNGMVILEVADPVRTYDILCRERHFVIDHRPGCIRISPHFFNTEADVTELMDHLDEVQQAIG